MIEDRLVIDGAVTYLFIYLCLTEKPRQTRGCEQERCRLECAPQHNAHHTNTTEKSITSNIKVNMTNVTSVITSAMRQKTGHRENKSQGASDKFE